LAVPVLAASIAPLKSAAVGMVRRVLSRPIKGCRALQDMAKAYHEMLAHASI
jgi:hypothetical protein